jgi:putative oxidoreductase
MSALCIGLALAIRVVLVLLFLPFIALDKVLDFRSALAQAQEVLPSKVGTTGLILVGLFVEVFMWAGVVSGVADRACAFVLALGEELADASSRKGPARAISITTK